jgi:hypothetical protein
MAHHAFFCNRITPSGIVSPIGAKTRYHDDDLFVGRSVSCGLLEDGVEKVGSAGDIRQILIRDVWL